MFLGEDIEVLYYPETDKLNKPFFRRLTHLAEKFSIQLEPFEILLKNTKSSTMKPRLQLSWDEFITLMDAHHPPKQELYEKALEANTT